MSASLDVEALAQLLNARVDARYGTECRVHLTDCTLDSRHVRAGALYCALPGHKVHGADYVHEAMAAGAVAVLTDQQGADRLVDVTIPVLVVKDARRSTADAASWIFGSPARDLTLWGVTGTNGKTTVSFLLDRALQASGVRTTLIGTLGHHVNATWHSNARTTPEAPDLHRILRDAKTSEVTDVVMEVSSIAVVEQRVRGLQFSVMGFTNLSHDHLDYHGSMENYYAAKASLFTKEMSAACAVGLDDEWGRRLASEVTIPLVTWSTEPGRGDWSVQRIQGGLSVDGESGSFLLPTAFPTRVLAANLACVAAMLAARGLDPRECMANLDNVAIPGRMEVVSVHGGVRAIVDYAHSPDAIDRVIAAVRPETKGKVLCVIGAGGDRDATKRHHMGVSAAAADLVIVTDDNPRSEDPARIRSAVLAGVHSVGHPIETYEIADRAEAIAMALGRANEGDTILILGKGHETGQEINGVMHPCDDRELIREWVCNSREESEEV